MICPISDENSIAFFMQGSVVPPFHPISFTLYRKSTRVVAQGLPLHQEQMVKPSHLNCHCSCTHYARSNGHACLPRMHLILWFINTGFMPSHETRKESSGLQSLMCLCHDPTKPVCEADLDETALPKSDGILLN